MSIWTQIYHRPENRPMILRDARRLATSRDRSDHWAAGVVARNGLQVFLQEGMIAEDHPILTASVERKLDYLISRMGHHWWPGLGVTERPAGESRPKGTDEVAPASDIPSDDAQLHGGDGNSGECDHQADTASDQSRTGESASSGGVPASAQPPGGPAEAGAGAGIGNPGDTEPAVETQHNADRPVSRDGAGPTAEAGAQHVEADAEPDSVGATARPDEASGQAHGEEPGEGMGSQRAGDTGIADKVEELPSSSPHTGDVQESDATPDAGIMPTDAEARGVGEEVAQTLRSAHQAMDWPPIQVARITTTSKVRANPSLLSAVRRLQEKFCGTGNPVPRIDGRALVTELVSRRVSLPRCYQLQRPDPLIILIVDISGSCSHVAGLFQQQAMAIAKACRNVVVALTPVPEGVPQTLIGVHAERVRAAILDGRRNYPKDAWGRCWASIECRAVIALGDWHGSDVYRDLAPWVPLYWLDHYTCSSVGKVRDQTKAKANLFSSWPVLPARYMVGVGSEEALAQAARMIT